MRNAACAFGGKDVQDPNPVAHDVSAAIATSIVGGAIRRTVRVCPRLTRRRRDRPFA